MKISKYNILVKYNNRSFVFNQLRLSLLELDNELAQAIELCNVDSIPQEQLALLSANGIICPQSLLEENVILARDNLFRFSNSTARVTILPTLNCNFHCWYCYEDHYKSFIKNENLEAIISFCKKLIIGTNIKQFRLDWFGGEPLLYFNETIYPISKALLHYCLQNKIDFTNTITTNGYLISPEIIEKMKEVQLKGFQITLDGGKEYHDKVRFTSKEGGSYNKIVINIIELCHRIPNIDMMVRINYTPSNLKSLEEIASVFPADIRSMIHISPQMVWQYKDDAHSYTKILSEKMKTFAKMGYKKTSFKLECSPCYTENMKQYVINYDLNVYKCTARKFQQNYSIGKILPNGDFCPNPHFYDFFQPASIQAEKCLKCYLLPSCLGNCIQKNIEKQPIQCSPENLLEQVKQKVLLYLFQSGILKN